MSAKGKDFIVDVTTPLDEAMANGNDGVLYIPEGSDSIVFGGKRFVSTRMVQQTETTVEIQPNILHVWGEVAELNITLADGEDGTINEYMVQFTSGSTATILTLPDSIVWMTAPSIQANKTYQLSIINNLGVIGEFGYE